MYQYSLTSIISAYEILGIFNINWMLWIPTFQEDGHVDSGLPKSVRHGISMIWGLLQYCQYCVHCFRILLPKIRKKKTLRFFTQLSSNITECKNKMNSLTYMYKVIETLHFGFHKTRNAYFLFPIFSHSQSEMNKLTTRWSHFPYSIYSSYLLRTNSFTLNKLK